MAGQHLIALNPQAQPASDLHHLINSTEIESLYIMFLYNCKSRGLSPKTLKDYQQKLGHFVHFCVQAKLTDPANIKDSHIDYFFLLKQQVGCKAVSIACYYRVMKHFFRHLVKKKMIAANPMDTMDPPRVPDKIITPFEVKHIQQMLSQCELNDSRLESSRDKAIILTFLDSGLRLSELTGILLENINEDAEIIKVMGKGGMERLVRVAPGVMEALCQYIIIRKKIFPDNHDHRLWLNSKGKTLSLTGIQQMIGRVGKRAGVEGVRCSPHTFRHTFATMFLDNASSKDRPGAGADELQALLGHKTRVMTQHYTASAKARIALRAHEKYSPMRNLNFDQ